MKSRFNMYQVIMIFSNPSFKPKIFTEITMPAKWYTDKLVRFAPPAIARRERTGHNWNDRIME